MSADLDAFFRPSSIAVVGVSHDPASYSRRLLGFLRRFEYPGFVVGVNPSLEEVDGVRCVPTLHDVGRPVDLVLVFTPAARVLDIMTDAADTGARATIVYSSGFAEVGAEGAALQDAVRDIAAGAGMRVLGPNCQGVIHVPARTIASFSNAAGALDLHRVGRVAYVGQSGAVGGAMFDLLRERGLTPAVWVSTGNQVDVDVTEVARHLLRDPAVDVILAYVEQTPDGAAWDVLGRAAIEAGKQIVALHPGATAAGRRAMLSHTGALVGERRPFELTSQANAIVMVDDLEPMIDVALARHGGAHRSGRRLAIITTSGGAGGLAADWCARCGLQVSALAPATRDAIDELLPDFASSVNPIDVTGMFVRPGPSRMGELCVAVSRDPDVDHVLLVLTNTVGEAARQLAHSIADAGTLMDAPLSVVYLAAADRTVDACEIMTDAGLPVFRGVAAALRAIGTLALAGEEAPDDAPPESPRFTVMSEADGRALLEEIGVACPASILAHSAREAEQASIALGGPTVVLKVQSPDVLHKSDAGAIALGVQPDDAQTAYDALVSRVREGVPTAAIQGVLVQERVDAGVELLVGLQAASGGYAPVLTVGIGGTAVEIYRDIANALAPVTTEQALEMLRTLRGWPLLDGFRGGARVDVEAAARAISAISGISDHLGDTLVDLEVNPLIVHGRGVHAVDFVCRLRSGAR